MLTEVEYRDLAKQFQAEMRTRFPRLRVYVSGANGENIGLDAVIQDDMLEVRAVLTIFVQRVTVDTQVGVASVRLALDTKDGWFFADIAIDLARQVGHWLVGSEVGQ